MDHFEDQFLADSPENLGLNFEDEAKFFDPEAAHEADFLHPAPVEESIYTDDPVRVYLREMGAVPLLTREGEVDLARRMERGKLRMQKAISRSALVQHVVVELSEALRKGTVELEGVAEIFQRIVVVLVVEVQDCLRHVHVRLGGLGTGWRGQAGQENRCDEQQDKEAAHLGCIARVSRKINGTTDIGPKVLCRSGQATPTCGVPKSLASDL